MMRKKQQQQQKTSKQNEQTLADLSSTHRRSQTKCQLRPSTD